MEQWNSREGVGNRDAIMLLGILSSGLLSILIASLFPSRCLAPGIVGRPCGLCPCPFLLVPNQRAKLDVCERGPIWAGWLSPNGIAERSFGIKA